MCGGVVQFRAVAVGLVIGVLLWSVYLGVLCSALRSAGLLIAIATVCSFTNTYFGLQTGWISMMSLQASLLG